MIVLNEIPYIKCTYCMYLQCRKKRDSQCMESISKAESRKNLLPSFGVRSLSWVAFGKSKHA